MRKIFIFFIIPLLPCFTCSAQIASWHTYITAEEQYNITDKKWNFASLADYGLNVNLWRGGQFNINGTSSYMQHTEDYLSIDPLVFSNLDAPSRAFRFTILGFSQQIGPLNIFLGVRNSVTDYFADDKLAIFLGSMHGIQPVISSNFDIATYPTSSICLHTCWQINDNIRINSTLYNGKSTDLIDKYFDFDGAANLSAINWHNNDRIVEAGFAVGKSNFGRISSVVYAYDIENFTEHFSMIGEIGYYFGQKHSKKNLLPEICAFNGAFGGVYSFNPMHSIGFIGTYARYNDAWNDFQIEMNYVLLLAPFTIQPAIVFDRNNRKNSAFAVLRTAFSIGR